MGVQVHHTGITVSDVERSAAFYKLFGLEEAARFVLEGDEFEAAVGVPGAVAQFVMLRGNNTVVELIEYKQGAGGSFGRGNNDVGSAHVCFTIDDMAETRKRLEEAGFPLVAEPTTPEDGTSFAFLRDPDGISVEILTTGPGATLEAMGVPSA
ncbi:MAG: VOC family protein [Actinobacteria bacterium]|nr:VOC family protein [Actinomycetota bacterium]